MKLLILLTTLLTLSPLAYADTIECTGAKSVLKLTDSYDYKQNKKCVQIQLWQKKIYEKNKNALPDIHNEPYYYRESVADIIKAKQIRQVRGYIGGGDLVIDFKEGTIQILTKFSLYYRDSIKCEYSQSNRYGDNL